VVEKIEDLIPHGTGVVLIVDDEEIIRDTARDILETCGYTVFVAENGETAVELFAERPHEIVAVILDMIMPKMSGAETLIELKRIRPDVKVLIASGFPDGEGIQVLADLGVSGFINKPYSLMDLATIMKQTVDLAGPGGSHQG